MGGVVDFVGLVPNEFHDVHFWWPGTVGGQQPNGRPITASFGQSSADFPASPLHGVLVLRGRVAARILPGADGSVQCGEVQRSFLHAHAVLGIELLFVVEAPFRIGNFPVVGVGQLAIQVPVQNRKTSCLGVGGGLADSDRIHQHVAAGPHHQFGVAGKILHAIGSPSPPALTGIAAVVQRNGWLHCILESKFGVHQTSRGQTDGHRSRRVQIHRHGEFGA